jgi:hypothetical protein
MVTLLTRFKKGGAKAGKIFDWIPKKPIFEFTKSILDNVLVPRVPEEELFGAAFSTQEQFHRFCRFVPFLLCCECWPRT